MNSGVRDGVQMSSLFLICKMEMQLLDEMNYSIQATNSVYTLEVLNKIYFS